MANHINHYKSLKKNTKSKREEIPIYPSTLFALFFVLFFSFFCCSFFYNDSIFYSQALLSSDCDVVCCCYRLSNFIQKQFFSPFLLFSTFVQTFSQLICMCVTFSFTSHPSQLPYHLCAVFIFFVVLSFSVCVQWILFIRLTIVRMVTREFMLFMSWRLFKTSQLYCTEIDKSWI